MSNVKIGDKDYLLESLSDNVKAGISKYAELTNKRNAAVELFTKAQADIEILDLALENLGTRIQLAVQAEEQAATAALEDVALDDTVQLDTVQAE